MDKGWSVRVIDRKAHAAACCPSLAAALTAEESGLAVLALGPAARRDVGGVYTFHSLPGVTINLTCPQPAPWSEDRAVSQHCRGQRGHYAVWQAGHCGLLLVFKVENSYSISVPIFKQFHKNIIGKGGANIKKVASWSLPGRVMGGKGSGLSQARPWGLCGGRFGQPLPCISPCRFEKKATPRSTFLQRTATPRPSSSRASGPTVRPPGVGFCPFRKTW